MKVVIKLHTRQMRLKKSVVETYSVEKILRTQEFDKIFVLNGFLF